MTGQWDDAAAHLAEAERLIKLAHGLNTNYRDDQNRVRIATESAGPLAAMATAHATIAMAIHATRAS
jgi:hypothetical protein